MAKGPAALSLDFDSLLVAHGKVDLFALGRGM